MRHHGRPDDADGDVERLRIGKDGRLWHETAEDFTHLWLGYGHLDDEAQEDHYQKSNYECFTATKAALHQHQDHQDVHTRDDYAQDKRYVERQVEGNMPGQDHAR